MKFDLIRHHRRSIRLRGYDYAQSGAYFVTICTSNRECLFGEITDGEIHLNDIGEIVAACWQDIPAHFENVALDSFAIMPNHLHGIIVIGDTSSIAWAKHLKNVNASPLQDRQPPRGTQSDSLGAMIQNFKSVTARRINVLRNTQGAPVWQRNYYEHVVRSDEELDKIRAYICGNAARWAEDENNPIALRRSK